MKKQSTMFQVLSGLSYLTQVGLSVATPLVLCLLGAWWLYNRLGAGLWVFPAGLLLGLVSGIISLWNFLRYVNKKTHDDRGKHP